MTDTTTPQAGTATGVTRTGQGSTAYRAGATSPAATRPPAPGVTRGVPPGVHRPGYEPGGLAAQPTPAAAPAPPGTVRRARLVVAKVDPWSTMKVAFTLSIGIAILVLVAVAILWFVLDSAGVFAALDRTVSDVAPESATWSVDEIVAFPRVMGFSLLIAVIEVVLVTALATLAAFMYNLTVGIAGGLEVTLAEDA